MSASDIAALRQYLPEKSTEIKVINGYYYVYRYGSKKLENGRWGKSSGKCIGKVVAGKGFIPNKYYLEERKPNQSVRPFNDLCKDVPDAACNGTDSNNCSVNNGGECRQGIYTTLLDEITILEYGQYAMAYKLANPVLSRLEQYFNADTASQIFSYAVILCVNGFIHLDQIKTLYEQSWLSLINKKLGFGMGRTALGSLLHNLAMRGKRVHNYEQSVIDDCAKGNAKIAIDGHAIRSCSDENDLAETGYKYNHLKTDQVNLLMGYDVEHGYPLFARVFRGSTVDVSTIKDITSVYEFKKILFIVDRGFYSSENLKLFSKNGSTFIIPLPSNTKLFKDTMTTIKYTGEFYYRRGKKHTRVEYMEREIETGRKLVVCRDLDENEKTRYNYLRCIDEGRVGYTLENFNKNKELFGVFVLLTNTKQSAAEIFKNYKKRWTIETFYQFLKNSADFNDLKIEDYYKETGFSFIMLITGQIHYYLEEAVKKLKDNTTSVYDALTMARFMKIRLNNGSWQLCNTRSKDLERMKKMGFEPDEKILVESSI